MTIEDLEKKKLEAEISFLEAQTKELDRPSEKKENWDGRIRRWSGLILSVISLGAAIWGFLIPINNYFQEQRYKLNYELSSNMVQLVTDLDSDTAAKADRAILLLSYYERNSLPILFYKLSRVSYFEKQTLVTNIVQVVAQVYENHRQETKKIILDNLDDQMRKLMTNTQIDDYNIFAIYNLLYLIENLPLNKKDLDDFLEIINQKETELKRSGRQNISLILTKINDCKNKLTSDYE